MLYISGVMTQMPLINSYNKQKDAEREAQMNDVLNSLLKEVFPETNYEIKADFQKDGLTNQNYRINVDHNEYIVRLARKNSHELGINRRAEYAAMKAAADIGVGADIVYFSTETGNMITRYINGAKWEDKDTTLPKNIKRIADVMKRIHKLPAISFSFSPYKDIYDRIEFARRNNLTLPLDIDDLVSRVETIQKERQKKEASCLGLCHNDPFPNNFLDTGTLRLIDWEYSGMGDIFFDLAIICMPYTKEQKEEFLIYYFGECDFEKLTGLKQMSYVVTLWNALWAVLQRKLSDGDADYEGIADYLFSAARKMP
ncbi:MAG: choline/ethanolamine kinase family protein [Mobilitalea sp.]